MTRSDLILEIARMKRSLVYVDRDNLISTMHQKIENVYTILFEMESVETTDPISGLVKELATRIRKALES